MRHVFGALFIKQRHGLTDEETLEQIREKCLHAVFSWSAGYSSKAPFDPMNDGSVRQGLLEEWRFSEEEISRINEFIA